MSDTVWYCVSRLINNSTASADIVTVTELAERLSSRDICNSLFIRVRHASAEGLHALMGPCRRCVSIPRQTRHYPVVGHPLIH